MMKEHDRVRLTEPLPESNLDYEAIGTIVHVYQSVSPLYESGPLAFEVEFTDANGERITETMLPWEIKPIL